MKVLDLGCGDKKVGKEDIFEILGNMTNKIQIVGLDIIKNSSVDIVHDLSKFPYPFNRQEFDIVYASHLLEHIQDNRIFFRLIKEIHRILKPNGLFVIKVPYYKGIFFTCMPEHTRYFNIFYFDYFDKNIQRSHTGHLSNFSGVNFKIIKKQFNMVISGRLKFLNILNPLYNLNKNFTEIFLSNILAPEELQFILQK